MNASAAVVRLRGLLAGAVLELQTGVEIHDRLRAALVLAAEHVPREGLSASLTVLLVLPREETAHNLRHAVCEVERLEGCEAEASPQQLL